MKEYQISLQFYGEPTRCLKCFIEAMSKQSPHCLIYSDGMLKIESVFKNESMAINVEHVCSLKELFPFMSMFNFLNAFYNEHSFKVDFREINPSVHLLVVILKTDNEKVIEAIDNTFNAFELME